MLFPISYFHRIGCSTLCAVNGEKQKREITNSDSKRNCFFILFNCGYSNYTIKGGVTLKKTNKKSRTSGPALDIVYLKAD